jgi:hypothetical protein
MNHLSISNPMADSIRIQLPCFANIIPSVHQYSSSSTPCIRCVAPSLVSRTTSPLPYRFPRAHFARPRTRSTIWCHTVLVPPPSSQVQMGVVCKHATKCSKPSRPCGVVAQPLVILRNHHRVRSRLPVQSRLPVPAHANDHCSTVSGTSPTVQKQESPRQRTTHGASLVSQYLRAKREARLQQASVILSAAVPHHLRRVHRQLSQSRMWFPPVPVLPRSHHRKSRAMRSPDWDLRYPIGGPQR